MSDETNNDNPLSEEPGWASPGSDQQGSVPPVPPTQPPTPGQPNPFPAPGYPQGQVPGMQPGTPYIPTPGTNQPQKKSKLWLWITLAIVVPLFFCGLGIGGCAILAVRETSGAVGSVNDFYSAAQSGRDLDPYTCEKFLDQGGFNEEFEQVESDLGEIDSYDFKSYNNENGLVTVEGTVTRDSKVFNTEVELSKENGKYKVCYVHER